MKTIFYALYTLITICILSNLFSCSKDQSESIVSPSSFINITQTIQDSPDIINPLKEIIQSDVNLIAGEITDFKITDILEFENDKFHVLDIKFTADTGTQSNVILTKRLQGSETGSLSGDDCYTVSCSGCQNCGVTATDEGNGKFSHSCWEACCEMTINDENCPPSFF